jgi:hypothetical protein
VRNARPSAETDWLATPEVGAAIGTMLAPAAAWIMQYWIRHLGLSRAPTRSSR